MVENGRVVRHGRAMDCMVTRRRRVIAVPRVSVTARMGFSARTSDMQSVDVDGEVMYRIVSPMRAASTFDFTVDPRTNEHLSDGPTAIRRTVLSVARDLMRDEISRMGAERVLGREPEVGRAVLIRLRHSPRLRELGVRPVDVFIKELGMKPETVRAIEGRTALRCAAEVTVAQGTGAAQPWRPMEHGAPSDDGVSTGVECTEDCPFRHMCGDYMDHFRDGKAWCTLFREFSM